MANISKVFLNNFLVKARGFLYKRFSGLWGRIRSFYHDKLSVFLVNNRKGVT